MRSYRVTHWRRDGVVVLAATATALAGWFWVQDRPLRAIRRAETKGDWSDASRRAVQYLTAHPANNEVLRVAGRCFSRLGQFAEAESFFQRASDLSLTDLRLQAVALKGLGRNASAATVLERILELDPGDMAALRQLALVKHSIGRTEEAIELAAKLGTDAKYATIAKLMQAIFWDDLGHGDSAVECLQQAVELEPSGDLVGSLPRDRVYVLLGRNLLRLGRAREAREILRQAVAAREATASCWYLGEAEMQCGDEEQAERWWKHALVLDPQYGPAFSSLGQLALRDRHSPEALRWLIRARECGDDSVALHSCLARAYARIGQEELMRAHQERADELKRQEEQERIEHLIIRQRPGSPEAQRILAERAKREGRFLEAEDLMSVLELPRE